MHAPNAVGNQYPKKLENHGNSGTNVMITWTNAVTVCSRIQRNIT